MIKSKQLVEQFLEPTDVVSIKKTKITEDPTAFGISRDDNFYRFKPSGSDIVESSSNRKVYDSLKDKWDETLVRLSYRGM